MGLEIRPAKLYMPKTDPDWVMVAPLDLASIGKNGGSRVAQTPQMQ